MKSLRLTAFLFLTLLSIPIAAGAAWTPPAVPAPGITATGDPAEYLSVHARTLDRVHDTALPGAKGADLMAFYYDQNVDRLDFRAQIFEMANFDGSSDRFLSEGTSLYIAFDYLPGGTRSLPDGIAGESPIAWDRCLKISGNGKGGVAGLLVDAGGDTGETERIRKVNVSARNQMVEGSVWLPGDFKEAALAAAKAKRGAKYASIAADVAAADATPVRFYVFTAQAGKLIDDLSASSSVSATAHNVAFVVHGNQGLTWTSVFYGERGETPGADGDPANPDDGFDELLDAHRYYNLPLNMHLSGQLQTAAEWYNPEFNDSMAAAVTEGWGDIVTSAYAQHMMPFAQNAMNDWAVQIEKDMSDWRYGDTAVVAWVPERVWLESPDNDGNGIAAGGGVVDNTLLDNWMNHGVDAVLLDNYIHLDYYNTVFDDRHVYVHSNGLKFIPMDGNFVGDMDNNWGNAWNTIIGLSSDEILVYGNDWEIPAEVSQGASNPSALNNWINILQQCSLNSGTVAVWKISDVIHNAPFLSSISNPTIQNGTYGLLGGKSGYGGSDNSWYIDWAAYSDPAHIWDFHTPTWDYGTIWNNTYNKIIASPSNSLSESAWYVMMSNLHETGWHDNGQISGWIYRYSNHIKNANVYAEASRWAAGLYANPTGAYLSDIDMDGVDEGVIYNDRVMAVIEPIGGKVNYLFAKGTTYGYSVIGNDNAYWPDTEGDYNETNHIAGLSDVSVAGLDREHDTYSISVVSGTGSTVSLDVVHPNVTKRINLTTGDKFLDVVYDAAGEDVYVKSGFTPDLVDVIWNAQMDRVWAANPVSGAYFGQRNPNTGATAAIVVGSGGAAHNTQYRSTILEVDELVASGQFEVYLFAGETSPPDVNGDIAELQALATALVDTLPPAPLSANYFPGPDRISIEFNEAVDYTSLAVTGISVDENDDGTADVTFGAGSSVITTTNGVRIDVQLDAATAIALEALNPAALELMMSAGSVLDLAGNGNPTVTNTDNVPITVAPVTLITIDGYFDPVEWVPATKIVTDLWDSQWTTAAPGDTNDINALYMTWDTTYLYLGIQGMVNGNSWLLYLDTDPGGALGQSVLDSLDTWERGAVLPFPADFQYGCYQHQGGFDSDSFWKITSDTTTQDLSGAILSAFDSQHFYYLSGGSELAIPWDVLYGLGAGAVPPGASISLVSSICWDPEPNGELGGDQAPDNIASTTPVLDNFVTITVDGNGDGLPDASNQPVGIDEGAEAAPPRLALLGNVPNPFNPTTTIRFIVPGSGGETSRTRVDVYDLAGRRVITLVDRPLPAGERAVVWNGTADDGLPVSSGLYFVRVRSAGEERTKKMTLIR